MSRRIHFRSAVYWTVGVGLWLVAAGMASAQQSDVSQAGWWRPRLCPPGTVPVYPSEAAPGAAQPQAAEPQPAEAAPPISALAGEVGGAEGPLGVPNMIGDLPGIRPMISASGFTFSNPVAGGAGFFKISDNENPLPTDRVFFNFNQYQNALSFNDGTAVHDSNLSCYVFGVEKTFFNGVFSAEFRIPFGTGFSAVETPTSAGAVTGTEFGNIPIVLKALLYNGEHNVFSGGMAVTLPTARDVNIGQNSLVIQNGSVHLQPYLMWLWRPQSRLFFMAFAGVDFDAGKNDVFVDDEFAGRYQEQSLLFFDGKIGYWLLRDPSRRWVTAVVPTVEVHYTTTMQNAPTVGAEVTPTTFRQDILDLTAGVQFQLGPCSYLTLGCAVPLRTNPGDKLFDTEYVVQFDRRF